MFPDRDAVIFRDQRLTYADLERLSAQAADVLRELGVRPQDRVGMVIPNVPAFVVWYYACLRLGAIAVSISTRLKGKEVAFILADCGAKIVVGVDTNDLVESMFGEMPASIEHVLLASEDASQVSGEPLAASDSIGEGVYANMEPDQPAIILYTSGTTGFPKGATLSHRNVRATINAFNHLCGMRTDERLLLSVPLFHCYGQNALLNSGLNVGATMVLQCRFDLGEAKRLIQDHQVTMLFGVPTTFQLLLESCEPCDLNSIRYCFSAAAKLPQQLGDAWRQKFHMPIFEGYGLTETAPFASYNHRLQFVPGSIGTPVDLVEMKIVDPDSGQDCPPGVPGEIAIRGPNVMLGYWNRPEETAAAIRNGWFYSGDIGQVDANGFFYIVDRLKDMIVVNGLKVFPAEVERVLLDHPAVAEAAVVGVAGAVMGETVVAFIVQTAEMEATPDEIRSHCQAHLASYKVPGRVIWIDELPHNPAGKVLKTILREIKLADLPQPQSNTTIRLVDHDSESRTAPLPTVGPLLKELRATHPASRERLLTSFLQDELRSLTGRREVFDVDEPIINADIDSLMIVELCNRLQVQIGSGIQLSATIVFDHPKLSDLATHLLVCFEQENETKAEAGIVSAQSASGAVRRDHQRPIKEDPISQDTVLQGSAQIENMSEHQAMEALLREVNDP